MSNNRFRLWFASLTQSNLIRYARPAANSLFRGRGSVLFQTATGPREVAGDCTGSPLARRIVPEGSGFEGNGLLIDEGGNDQYRGKTAMQGSGHVGGVGIQRDLGRGADRNTAIRNAQGFSLAGSFGLAQDDGGNDRYSTYMPGPLDPDAPFQADGSGGVVVDTGVCDDLPRMVQGAALLGGFGGLFDQDGADVYVARQHTAVHAGHPLFPFLAGLWL